MSHHPAVLPSAGEDGGDTPILRVADHAISLWHAAEASGDTALLESLRPLLMQIGRALARDIMSDHADETPQ